jgi:hypothetical protein
MHAIIILDMLLNNNIEAPYNKIFNGDEVPLLNKTLVKSTLSQKIKNYSVANHVENLQNTEKIKQMKIRGQSSKLKENKRLLRESKTCITF